MYSANRGGIHILREVFSKKAYNDLFPFFQKVTVVDIGGHFGYFSIFAALHLHPASQIFSIEPADSSYNILSQNLNALSHSNIVALHFALAGKSEHRNLVLSQPQNNSLYQNYIPGNWNTQQVNCFSLDDFIKSYNIQKIDFMKLDCEGSEYEILMNASPDSLRIIQTISMEMHDMRLQGYDPNSLIDYMNKIGLKLISKDSESLNFKEGFNTKCSFSRIDQQKI